MESRKRKLVLDSLNVDSFTTGEAVGTGTVKGYVSAANSNCYYPTPSCGPTETQTAPTCLCLYPASDVRHICCQSDQWCAQNCGTAPK